MLLLELVEVTEAESSSTRSILLRTLVVRGDFDLILEFPFGAGPIGLTSVDGVGRMILPPEGLVGVDIIVELSIESMVEATERSSLLLLLTPWYRPLLILLTSFAISSSSAVKSSNLFYREYNYFIQHNT